MNHPERGRPLPGVAEQQRDFALVRQGPAASYLVDEAQGVQSAAHQRLDHRAVGNVSERTQFLFSSRGSFHGPPEARRDFHGKF
jgi:hypothetical protein